MQQVRRKVRVAALGGARRCGGGGEERERGGRGEGGRKVREGEREGEGGGRGREGEREREREKKGEGGIMDQEQPRWGGRCRGFVPLVLLPPHPLVLPALYSQPPTQRQGPRGRDPRTQCPRLLLRRRHHRQNS
jgi:hypothetical protein